MKMLPTEKQRDQLIKLMEKRPTVQQGKKEKELEKQITVFRKTFRIPLVRK